MSVLLASNSSCSSSHSSASMSRLLPSPHVRAASTRRVTREQSAPRGGVDAVVRQRVQQRQQTLGHALGAALAHGARARQQSAPDHHVCQTRSRDMREVALERRVGRAGDRAVAASRSSAGREREGKRARWPHLRRPSSSGSIGLCEWRSPGGRNYRVPHKVTLACNIKRNGSHLWVAVLLYIHCINS